jgi:hypothetical protein
MLGLGHFFDRADAHRFAGPVMKSLALFALALKAHIHGGQPLAVRILIGFVIDHALRKQALERLFHIKMAGFAHGAGKKA